jgi:hypothetical protein
MKTQIIDADALRAISTTALIAFARTEGWSKVESFGDHADVYAGPNRPEIIIPRTERLADYPAVVSQLIDIFASTTDQDEMVAYRNLIGADSDVVRVRAIGADDDGSVPLEAGVKIVSQARDMLLAAACSVRAPQPLYRAGANKEANDYMQRVKLGQTEHGSFVVTLLSPVPPSLTSSQLPLDVSLQTFDDEPMERLVTRRLMQALEASREAAERVISGETNAFEESITLGVSANLCEAVAALIEQSDGLDIGVTWARTRPRNEPFRKISFTQNDGKIFKEAARTFRLKQPKLDVTLYGDVHILKREPDEFDGIINLRTIIDDKIQSVTAVLDQNNFQSALKALDSKKQVIVTGDLERVGSRWRITNSTLREVQSEDVEDIKF